MARLFGLMLLGFLAACKVSTSTSSSGSSSSSDRVLSEKLSSNDLIVTDFRKGTDTIYELLTQSDGKIVAVGRSMTSTSIWSSDTALARYDAKGKLDKSFGSEGKVVTAVGEHDDLAMAAVLQSDGKILVGGYTNNSSDFSSANAASSDNYDSMLVRYLSNGSLDASFGNGGIVVTDVGGGMRSDQIYALALQADGKIITVGTANVPQGFSTRAMAITRRLSNGALDTSFAGTGEVLIYFARSTSPSASDNGYSVAIQPDGKIVVGGSASYDDAQGMRQTWVLVRLTSDGALDPSFGNLGKVVSLAGSEAVDLALQGDGKILVVGGGWNSSNLPAHVVGRFTSLGVLDTSFGNAGTAALPYGWRIAGNLRVTTDGKITVGGSADVNSVPHQFAFARFTSAGQLDLSFGDRGVAYLLSKLGAFRGYAFTLAPDKSLVVGGSLERHESSVSDFALTRYK